MTATPVQALTGTGLAVFGSINCEQLGQGGYQLVATQGPTPGTTGLNIAGYQAVATAVNTYLSGLSTAKKAGLPNGQEGCPSISINFSGISVPVHPADVATFAATLATTLNNSSNYGTSGT